MSRRRARQVSAFSLASVLTLSLSFPAAAQPLDRLDFASFWRLFHEWIQPTALVAAPPGRREAAVMSAGLVGDPDGAAVAPESPAGSAVAGTSPPDDH